MRALDQIVPVILQVPLDINAVGIARKAFDMRGYESVLIRLLTGNVAGDLTLVFQQDKHTTITTADKALHFTKYFRKSGLNYAYEEVTQAAGNTLVIPASGGDNMEYMVEFSAAQLDVNGRYNVIAITAPVVGSACVVALEAIFFRSRRGMGNRGGNFDSLTEIGSP